MTHNYVQSHGVLYLASSFIYIYTCYKYRSAVETVQAADANSAIAFLFCKQYEEMITLLKDMLLRNLDPRPTKLKAWLLMVH
jgi:hypothetical protein